MWEFCTLVSPFATLTQVGAWKAEYIEAMKTRRFLLEAPKGNYLLIAATVLVTVFCFTSGATAQSKQSQDFTPLGAGSLLTPDHSSLRLHQFEDEASLPDFDGTMAVLVRNYHLARQAVEHRLSLRSNHGRRTADLPVPMFDLTLQVDSDNLGYTLFDKRTGAGEITFGPYIHNWRSARQSFTGHYGLRLQVPW